MGINPTDISENTVEVNVLKRIFSMKAEKPGIEGTKMICLVIKNAYNFIHNFIY